MLSVEIGTGKPKPARSSDIAERVSTDLPIRSDLGGEVGGLQPSGSGSGDPIPDPRGCIEEPA